MIETTVFAYQIVPGKDDLLFFSETLQEAQAAAMEQRQDIKRYDPDFGDLEPMAIYKCVLKLPDLQTLLRVLNEQVDPISAYVVDRSLVALVMD